MIDADAKEDLSTVYSLLARVSALPVLRKEFLEYVKVRLRSSPSLFEGLVIHSLFRLFHRMRVWLL